MVKTLQFPVVVEKEGNFYTAECPLLPGCYTQGKTIEEALANIKEVINLLSEEKEAGDLIRNYQIQDLGLHTINIRLNV